jgi:hypothetical protein
MRGTRKMGKVVGTKEAVLILVTSPWAYLYKGEGTKNLLLSKAGVS